jgi:RND family efflux transporter MFP subunit
VKRILKWGERALLIASLLGIGYYFFFGTPTPISYQTEAVASGDIEQIISVNGTVGSDNKIQLRFQKTGKVEQIKTSVGQKVKKGDVLAVIDSDMLALSVQNAKSAYDMAVADLNVRYAGPTEQEIKISEKNIEEARIILEGSLMKPEDTAASNEEKIKKAELDLEKSQLALENAQSQYDIAVSSGNTTGTKSTKALVDLYENANTEISASLDTLTNAITNADSVMGMSTKGLNIQYAGLLSAKNPTFKVQAENFFPQANFLTEQAKASYAQIEKPLKDEETTKLLLSNVESALLMAKNLSDSVANSLDNTITDYRFSQSDLDLLKTKIIADQNNITARLTQIRTLRQAIDNASLDIFSTSDSVDANIQSALSLLEQSKKTLEISKRTLADLKIQNRLSQTSSSTEVALNQIRLEQLQANHAKLVAKPRSIDTASLRARVSQANTEYKRALKELENAKIIAPSDGVITEINLKEGEITMGTENAMVMLVDSLRIKANIAETDITKIALDNAVSITLDAFPPDQIFSGKVVEISPAETIIQGVIYYEVNILFNDHDQQIKSGMTANLDILSSKKENVLKISSEALQYDGNTPFVYVLHNNQKERRNIEVGIMGETEVEVISGISEQEDIVLYEKQ